MTIINLNTAVTQNIQNQIDQILREFEMGCDKAILRREGKRMILEPKKRPELLNNNKSNGNLTFLPLSDIRI